MKKVIKFIRNNTLILIIGIILGTVTIVLADTITANIVIYDTTISGKSSNTVQDAIDDLYTGLYSVGNATSSGLSLILHIPQGLSANYEPNLLDGNGKQLGLKRFQGTTADNYICFGTTNPGTCTGSPGTYMYRIIGIDADGRMKLIKNTAVTSRNWNSSTGVEWPQSSLYADLNGSYFLTNPTYIPDSTWSNRIADTDWHYWTGTDVNMSAADVANAELGAATVNAKIGLMYIHDYAYALAGGNNCSSSGALETCKTSWIYLSEWTISRYNASNAWNVTSTSNAGYGRMVNSRAVRPVFYLSSNQVITGGKGTEFEPYYLR